MSKQEYDYRGRDCPEGYILVTRLISKLNIGEKIEVIMDSWRCATMIAYEFSKIRSIEMNIDRLNQKDIKFTFSKRY
ncbi:MAG: hypothetical protein ACP5I6_02840 [Caldisphaera sp.]|nr:MAG: hypothetical protein C0201_02545 [Caldisphaera sp.]PMP90482.1 MAG: hypothetical protein C0171_04845 [Caldisphaera sp.]